MQSKKRVFSYTIKRDKILDFVYSLLILAAVVFFVVQFFFVREVPEKVVNPRERDVGQKSAGERTAAESDLVDSRVRDVSLSKTLQNGVTLRSLGEKERLQSIMAEASAAVRASELAKQAGVGMPGGYIPPKFDLKTTGKLPLDLSLLDKSLIRCGFVDRKDANVSLDYADANGISLPDGFEIVGTPIAPKCEGESLDLTFNVPQDFVDISVLRCQGSSCDEIKGFNTSLNELVCGGISAGDARQKEIESRPLFVSPSEWGAKFESGKVIKSTDRFLLAGNYLFEFPDYVPNNFVVRAISPSKNVSNPVNPELFIVGVPVFLKVYNASAAGVRMRVRVAVPQLAHFDSSNLGFYVASGEGWDFVGGVVDDSGLFLEVDDLSKFLGRDDSVVLSVMGLMCISCDVASLEKIYSGSSRDVIVFVHGLFSSPFTWQSLIDEYVVNKQPWQIWALTYPSNLTTSVLAGQFVDSLKLHASEFDNVYLVGHSFGAFVIQSALMSAVEQNASFVKKIKKVILIGSPNDGTPVLAAYQRFFRYVVNSKESAWLFSVSNRVVTELAKGLHIPRVGNISYYVIAGTQPYELNFGVARLATTDVFVFSGHNDGLTSVSGAQHVGYSYVNRSCEDFYEVPATHTDLTSFGDTKKIISRILSEDLWKSKSTSEPIAGFNKYVRFVASGCRSGEKYVIAGRRIGWKFVEAPLNCACGNAVCGFGENKTICPKDCTK